MYMHVLCISLWGVAVNLNYINYVAFGFVICSIMSLPLHVIVCLQRYGPKMLDHEGKEVPGNRGYK